MKKTMLLIVAVLILSAGNAFAFPTIDGIASAGEWTTGLLLNAGDPNEVGIPDSYDISRVKIISESISGANDGFYFLWQLNGTPSFTTLDPLGSMPVVYLLGLDMNQDGDYSDLVDRKIQYTSAGFSVTDGTNATVSGSPQWAMGSVVEYYLPASMFVSFPDTSINGFLLLDNGGSPADDQLPDQGTFKTPEPGSMMLLGMGLIGFAGSLLRKKFTA